MRITKFGHACVRIEHEGTTVVLDPGVFTDREALDGADAILITHEHVDHYVPDHLKAVDAPVWTIDAVATKIREDAPEVFERTTVVAPGDSFAAVASSCATRARSPNCVCWSRGRPTRLCGRRSTGSSRR